MTRALGRGSTAYWACLALGEIGAEAEPAVPALQHLLETSKNLEVRREAVLSLGAIGPPAAPAVAALVCALAEEDRGIRIGAAYALGQIGPAAKAAVGAACAIDRRQPAALLADVERLGRGADQSGR